jgi:hypothetical protein
MTVTAKGHNVMLIIIVVSAVLTLIDLLQETQTDFQDLGKLLLGGAVAAIAVGIVFTLVRLRIRDKKPQTSSFISIGDKSKN